ncbi:MAG: hypothetical protein ACRDEA_04935 [Microcystaceae cyanobacterium]
MMNIKLIDSLVQIINTLTEEERQILNQKLTLSIPVSKISLSNLEDESFIGMWKEREDMKASGEWTRQLRRQEWQS